MVWPRAAAHAWLALWGATASGCLVINEDFDDGVGGSGDGGSTGTAATMGTSIGSSGASQSTAVSASGGGSAGGSGGVSCPADAYELNNQEESAAALPEILFSSPALVVDAQLEDADEVDWYAVHVVADGGENAAMPTAMVTDALGLCAYVLCDAGILGTNVECEGLAVPLNSPIQGLRGCCAQGAVSMTYGCTSPDPTATAYFAVTGPGDIGPGNCGYTLTVDY